MFSITDLAKEKIKEVLQANPGKYLRVIVAGFGWGGPQLGLALDEPQGAEVAIPINGIDVLIDDKVKTYTYGNTLDYIKSDQGEGFVINKPDSDECGGGCSGC